MPERRNRRACLRLVLRQDHRRRQVVAEQRVDAFVPPRRPALAQRALVAELREVVLERIVRDAGDDAPALVVLSRASTPTALTVPAAVAPGWYKDAMSGERVEIAEGGASLELAAFGVRILLPETNDCGEIR